MTDRFYRSDTPMTCIESDMTIAYPTNDEISILTRLDYYIRSLGSGQYGHRLLSPDLGDKKIWWDTSVSHLIDTRYGVRNFSFSTSRDDSVALCRSISLRISHSQKYR